MVFCLEQGADLHMAQLLPLPLTVSCFSKIQTGFTFLVPADPGSPRHRAVRRLCVVVGYTRRSPTRSYAPTDQCCPWVGLTYGLGRVGSRFFSFWWVWLRWVGHYISTSYYYSAHMLILMSDIS